MEISIWGSVKEDCQLPAGVDRNRLVEASEGAGGRAGPASWTVRTWRPGETPTSPHPHPGPVHILGSGMGTRRAGRGANTQPGSEAHITEDLITESQDTICSGDGVTVWGMRRLWGFEFKFQLAHPRAM